MQDKIIERRTPITGAGVARSETEQKFIIIRVTEKAENWTAELWDPKARRHALYACEVK